MFHICLEKGIACQPPYCENCVIAELAKVKIKPIRRAKVKHKEARKNLIRYLSTCDSLSYHTFTSLRLHLAPFNLPIAKARTIIWLLCYHKVIIHTGYIDGLKLYQLTPDQPTINKVLSLWHANKETPQ